MKKSGSDCRSPAAARTLADLRVGETGRVEALALPDDVASRLMELGFIPGCSVTAGRSGPSGDPRVFLVDGSEIALRSETARRIAVEGPA
ncbi:MAG: FeoA family protein [Gemmatimonadales bacterium]|nr:FeoA family protein [Gemmatimonadales bacterium]